MRYLTLSEVLEVHRSVLELSGGSPGIRDLSALESAIVQPKMQFAATELYATLEEKATALCYSLVSNHPFVDGNKRVGHAAMEVFLILNGYEITASVDEQERIMLSLAGGELSRDQLLEWVSQNVTRVVS